MSRCGTNNISQGIEMTPIDCQRGGLYLISCVKLKLSMPSAAKDLYISDWFRKARSYVEKKGRPWFILSAKHGLVHPATVIDPYEKTLKGMPIAGRREWARTVVARTELHVSEGGCVVILAGQRYREFVTPALSSRGITVIVPMAGLRFGEQLSWLGQRIHE